MTTTLPAMEKTIRLLHTMEEPPVIFVGGAVVTPEYAKQMNADYYARMPTSRWRSPERSWDDGYPHLFIAGKAIAV